MLDELLKWDLSNFEVFGFVGTAGLGQSGIAQDFVYKDQCWHQQASFLCTSFLTGSRYTFLVALDNSKGGREVPSQKP